MELPDVKKILFMIQQQEVFQKLSTVNQYEVLSHLTACILQVLPTLQIRYERQIIEMGEIGSDALLSQVETFLKASLEVRDAFPKLFDIVLNETMQNLYPNQCFQTRLVSYHATPLYDDDNGVITAFRFQFETRAMIKTRIFPNNRKK